MSIIICGTYGYKNKAKRCLNCKHYFMWGISAGNCLSTSVKPNKITGRYRVANDRCKYHKRNSKLFDRDGNKKE